MFGDAKNMALNGLCSNGVQCWRAPMIVGLQNDDDSDDADGQSGVTVIGHITGWWICHSDANIIFTGTLWAYRQKGGTNQTPIL